MPASTTGDHFLTVSSLSEHKRVDIAVAAFSRLGLPLYVVGEGPDESRLRKRAAPNVTFLGRVDEGELAQLYATCKAFVFPSDEDFGIAPVEAQACGRPVIAYGGGGALETVMPGVTGELFADQSAAALEEVLQDFNADAYRPADIRENALRFSTNRFKQEFGRLLADTVEEYENNASYTWPRPQAL
jgi:glycosyltransferase involved in cell wall biosynthesis